MEANDLQQLLTGAAIPMLVLAAVVLAIAGSRYHLNRRRPQDDSESQPSSNRPATVLGTVLAVAGLMALTLGLAPFGSTIAGNPIAVSTKYVGFSAQPAPPPSPLALLNSGDCVAVTMTESSFPGISPGQKSTKTMAGSPTPADCASLQANYRVLQSGPQPCTGTLYRLETKQEDSTGKLVYHLCLAYDWRAGICYDTADIDNPTKVICSTSGANVVKVTAVLLNSLDGKACPLDVNGAVSVTWDKRQMTVCFRGSDNPGR